MAPKIPLGELLVEAQMITREQLEEVLALQQHDRRRLGTLLVENGLVTETQVTQILSQQLSVPWVSLHHIDFARQLLNLVPRELAERFCLVPIFVRKVRGYGETLYVAMDEPGDDAALQEVSQYAGLPVRVMIAPPSDIRSAIRAYYGTSDRPDGAERPVVEVAEPAPPRSLSPSPAPVSLKPSSDPLPSDEDSLEPREVSMPPPRRGSVPKMVTLTLLDGTRVNLPAKTDPPTPDNAAGAEDQRLTARDLITALRAAAGGADTKEVLGEDAQWERLFAALLSLLMKKQLIADWDFTEELKKI